MPIPESQLETWANVGAQATAKRTYQSVKTALGDHEWPDGLEPEVYLQGSYRNTTNIYGNSDVDIVARLPEVWEADTTRLSWYDSWQYDRYVGEAGFTYAEYRDLVVEALEEYYGTRRVEDGPKAVKIDKGDGRLAADVVPSLSFRVYHRFRTPEDQSYIEGMTFHAASEGHWYINFPKRHYEQGARKNKETPGTTNFRSMVRVYKNVKARLEAGGSLPEDSAPSYFLSCLLFNVPSERFSSSYQQTFIDTWSYLNNAMETGDWTQMRCQHGVHGLFGDDPVQWDARDAVAFLDAVRDLWESW